MTVEEYTRIALAQPEAVESSHINHPDFRVRNKIFATIRSVEKGEGALKLTSLQRRKLMKEFPKGFSAAAGAWGKRGWTIVKISLAPNDMVEEAMRWAWRNTAPKRLVAQIEKD